MMKTQKLDFSQEMLLYLSASNKKYEASANMTQVFPVHCSLKNLISKKDFTQNLASFDTFLFIASYVFSVSSILNAS